MKKKFPDNKFFRRLALVWAMGLITWTVVRVFARAPNISAGTATALATVVGILTVVVGFYQWSRQQEDKKGKTDDKSDKGPQYF